MKFQIIFQSHHNENKYDIYLTVIGTFDSDVVEFKVEYNNEDKFIGVFTQERAIRLIQENNISFDVLYIDEAHNLFEKQERNLSLSSLFRLCFPSYSDFLPGNSFSPPKQTQLIPDHRSAAIR